MKPDRVQSPLEETPLETLEEIAGYTQAFMDLQLWKPYVRWVCARHGWGCSEIRSGLPGTYPTFIVDDRYVVKFFGRLFEGATGNQVEREASRLLATEPFLPTPALLAEGCLFDEPRNWSWPYLVFAFIPGVSISEVYTQVPFEDKLALASQMGIWTRRLDSLSLGESTIFTPSWANYTRFLANQRVDCSRIHRQRGRLLAHLLDLIDAYLLPVDQLVDETATPHLIHADLTRDHIIGRLEDGHWITMGLIDFGDAMVGSLDYELVALHLSLFNGDKRLLKAFLEAYGFEESIDPCLPARAMTMTLLHRFDIMEWAVETFPQINTANSLEWVAARLWDINTSEGLTAKL